MSTNIQFTLSLPLVCLLYLVVLTSVGRVEKMSTDKEKEKTEKDRSYRKISRRDTILKNVFRSFKHTIWNVEQTDFHSDFVRMYEEAKEFGKITKSIIERIKNMVQRNDHWQHDLTPPPDEYTPLDLFVSCLSEDGKCLKAKSSKVATFYEKLSASIAESGKAHSQYLLFVKANTLHPMEKYVNDELEQIRTEYYKLQRYKTIYDEGRNKLKHCPAEKIEKAATDLNDIKSEFEKQANLVTELLQRLPDHKENQRKAIRQMSLAMRLYHEKSSESLIKMLRETSDIGGSSSIASKSSLK